MMLRSKKVTTQADVEAIAQAMKDYNQGRDPKVKVSVHANGAIEVDGSITASQLAAALVLISYGAASE